MSDKLDVSLVDAERGFLVHEKCEVDIANAMLKNAAQAIMAVDQSKFIPQDRRPALRQPALKNGDIIVTDSNPESKFDTLLQGISVVIPRSNWTLDLEIPG